MRESTLTSCSLTPILEMWYMYTHTNEIKLNPGMAVGIFNSGELEKSY